MVYKEGTVFIYSNKSNEWIFRRFTKEIIFFKEKVFIFNDGRVFLYHYDIFLNVQLY